MDEQQWTVYLLLVSVLSTSFYSIQASKSLQVTVAPSNNIYLDSSFARPQAVCPSCPPITCKLKVNIGAVDQYLKNKFNRLWLQCRDGARLAPSCCGRNVQVSPTATCSYPRSHTLSADSNIEGGSTS